MPRPASETTLADATLAELFNETWRRERDIAGPDIFWDEDRRPYQVAGYFKPVQALVTKALGPEVWDDLRFITLWESYCDRKRALDCDNVMPFEAEFEAGLVVGMWSGNSALSTIKGRPWIHGDYDDKENTYTSSLAKLRRRSPTSPTAAEIRRVLGAVGPTMAEHHLIAACAESRYGLEVEETILLLQSEERRDLSSIMCTTDPKTGGLVFQFIATDPRVEYIESRFAREDDLPVPVFKVRPSSLIGRFIRTIFIAEVELDRRRDMYEAEAPPSSPKALRKTPRK